MKKFKFSPSGKLFVIAGNMDMDTIHIYDCSVVDTLLSEKVAKGKYFSAIKAPEIKDTLKVVFSKDEERLFIGTNRSILSFFVKDGVLISNIPIPLCYGKYSLIILL